MRHLHRNRWILLLIVVCAIGSTPTDAGARESTCPELIKPQEPVDLSIAGEDGSETLSAVNNEGIAIGKATLAMDFGPERSQEIRTQTYRLSSGIDPDSVRVSTVNDFVDGNDPLPIGHEQLTYRAGENPTGELVNVRVCYDPGGYNEPDPGRYVGALWVSAPGVEPVPLGVEFTFRSDDMLGVVVALLIGILAGVVLQALAIRQQAPKDRRPSDIRSYVLNFRILVAIGGGVAAGVAAYSNLVAGDPTWNGSVSSLFSLVTATFGATVITKAAIDLKGPTETEKRDGLAG